jgi:hypothetical protein
MEEIFMNDYDGLYAVRRWRDNSGGICDDCMDCGCPFSGCPPSCKCECHWSRGDTVSVTLDPAGVIDVVIGAAGDPIRLKVPTILSVPGCECPSPQTPCIYPSCWKKRVEVGNGATVCVGGSVHSTLLTS